MEKNNEIHELRDDELENVTGGNCSYYYDKRTETYVPYEQGQQFTSALHPGKKCTIVLLMGEGFIYTVDGEPGTFSNPYDSLLPSKDLSSVT